MGLHHFWFHGTTPFLVPWAYTISGSMGLHHFWFHGTTPFLVPWAYTICGSMGLHHFWFHGPTPFVVPWAYTISGSMGLHHFWFHGPTPFLVPWDSTISGSLVCTDISQQRLTVGSVAAGSVHCPVGYTVRNIPLFFPTPDTHHNSAWPALKLICKKAPPPSSTYSHSRRPPPPFIHPKSLSEASSVFHCSSDSMQCKPENKAG